MPHMVLFDKKERKCYFLVTDGSKVYFGVDDPEVFELPAEGGDFYVVNCVYEDDVLIGPDTIFCGPFEKELTTKVRKLS